MSKSRWLCNQNLWMPSWLQQETSVHQKQTRFQAINERVRYASHRARYLDANQQIQELSLNEHIYIGVEEYTNRPLFIDRRAYEPPSQFLGPPGQGKTVSMARQLYALLAPHRRADGGMRHVTDACLVYIDLKADENDYKYFQAIAHALGIPFQWFTLDSERSSYYFSFLHHLQHYCDDLFRFISDFSEAASLIWGLGYGEGHFGSVNQQGVAHSVAPELHSQAALQSQEVFAGALQNIELPGSWAEIHQGVQRARQMLGGARSDHLHQLDFTLSLLRSVPQLGNLDGQAHPPELDFNHLCDTGGVLYFQLSPGEQPVLAPIVGKLVVCAAFLTMLYRAHRGLAKKRMYLAVDECHHIANALQLVATQGRSHGISLMLANQSLASLKSLRLNAADVILDSTVIKQYYGVLDQDLADELMKSSGQELITLRSRVRSHTENDAYSSEDVSFTKGDLTSTTETEHWVSKLTQADLNLVKSRADLSVLVVASGQSGFGDFGGVPVVVRSDFPIFRNLESYTWPDIPASQWVQPVITPVEEEAEPDNDEPETVYVTDLTLRRIVPSQPRPQPQASQRPQPVKGPGKPATTSATSTYQPSPAILAWRDTYQQKLTQLADELFDGLF